MKIDVISLAVMEKLLSRIGRIILDHFDLHFIRLLEDVAKICTYLAENILAYPVGSIFLPVGHTIQTH